jgi:hypothetical protein
LTAAEVAAGVVNHGARTGVLAHVGYTGSAGGAGGAMEFVDEVILFCPQYGSPTPALNSTLYSDAVTVARWYQDTTTSPGSVTVNGRIDAEAVGDSGGATPTGGGGGNAQLPNGTTYLGAVCYSEPADATGALPADTGADDWMFVEQTSGGVNATSYRCGPEATAGQTSTCTTTCGKFPNIPSVSSGALVNGYSFNGLTPNVSSSGIPVDPPTIVTKLAPLLCGTGIGTAWTGQPNCP